MNALIVLAALMVCVVLAPTASADTIYNYTGNPMTLTTTGTADVCGGGTSPCSITGTFTVATPLGDSMALTTITPEVLSFSFSDGNQTIDSGVTKFEVGTDVNGNINAWYIEVGTGTDYIWLRNNGNDQSDNGYVVYEHMNPGTWNDPPAGNTAPAATVTTPEPSSLFLLSSGLIGLGFIKRKVFRG